MRVIFLLPIVFGVTLIAASYALFRRNEVTPKYFGIAVIVSILLFVSPLLYMVVIATRSFFGIQYSFVLGFGLAIVFLFITNIYLILQLGEIRREMETIWEEVALTKNQLDTLEDDVN